MKDFLVIALESDAELYHHGIEGMHWGERRYQNYDGSLTEAGRQRYGVGKARKEAKQSIRQLEENVAYSQYNKKRAEKDLDKITGRGTIFARSRDQLNPTQRQMYDQQMHVYTKTLQDLSNNMDAYMDAVNKAKDEFGDTKIKDIKYRNNGDVKAYIQGEKALKTAGIPVFLLASMPIGAAMMVTPELMKSKQYKKMKKYYQDEYQRNLVESIQQDS